jgi:hypothetical protein
MSIDDLDREFLESLPQAYAVKLIFVSDEDKKNFLSRLEFYQKLLTIRIGSSESVPYLDAEELSVIVWDTDDPP